MNAAVPGKTRAPSHGRWLVLARIAWIAVALLTVGLFTAAIPARYEQLLVVSPRADTNAGELTPAVMEALARLGLSSGFHATYFTAFEIVVALVYVAVGAVIAWQRADDRMALFVGLTLTALGPAGMPTMLALGEQYPVWQPVITGLRAFAWGCAIIFCFLFPDGRFVPAWTRPLALIWLLCTVAALLVPPLRPPVGVMIVRSPVEVFRILWFLGWMGICAFAQGYRYRHVSNLVQRQQTKWVVFGCLALVLLVLAGTLPSLVGPALHENTPVGLLYHLPRVTLVLLGLLLVPTTIGIAILRYRLFEVDLLINRTLVYATLSVTLALVYWGSVVLLQQLLRPIMDGGNNLEIVASTLTIAALFHPLRRRIQRGIDRRFYRRKYDAARTLQEFSAHLRDEMDLNLLRDDLLAVVAATVQPAHVSLWLRDAPPRRRFDGEK